MYFGSEGGSCLYGEVAVYLSIVALDLVYFHSNVLSHALPPTCFSGSRLYGVSAAHRCMILPTSATMDVLYLTPYLPPGFSYKLLFSDVLSLFFFPLLLAP